MDESLGEGTPFKLQSVFNQLQNFRQHVKVFDLRPAAEFETAHLAQAVWLAPFVVSETLVLSEVVPAHTFRVAGPRRFCILILATERLEEQATWLTAEFRRLKCQHVTCLLNTAEFLHRYPFLCKEGPRRSYPNEILPQRIFLGDLKQALDPQVVHTLGITHILNATPKKVTRFVANGVTYCNVPIDDHDREQIHYHFRRSFDFISQVLNSPQGRILVHCAYGVSRSVTLVTMFLMRNFDLSMDQALNFVKEQRVVAQPNEGFLKLLGDFEQGQMMFERSKSAR